jgi:hypothetical protein
MKRIEIQPDSLTLDGNGIEYFKQLCKQYPGCHLCVEIFDEGYYESFYVAKLFIEKPYGWKDEQ